MNQKLFYGALATTFAMLFWLVLEPTHSMGFIGARIITAFVSVVLVLFSATWHEPKGWRIPLLVLLFIVGGGSVGYIIFVWGLSNYPYQTMIACIGLVIGILLYIKFFEPKVIAKIK